jgi:hypothetical protein
MINTNEKRRTKKQNGIITLYDDSGNIYTLEVSIPQHNNTTLNIKQPKLIKVNTIDWDELYN